MIYRDDDISVHTDAYLFKQLHQRFIEKKQVHTVAVIMKDLWQNQAIFWYLATAPYLEIGLHGWEHVDYSLLTYQECLDDLKLALNYWVENSDRMNGGHKDITTFFAPWNHESENIQRACKELGLKFCNVKKGTWAGQKIKSFHWWSAVMDDNYPV